MKRVSRNFDLKYTGNDKRSLRKLVNRVKVMTDERAPKQSAVMTIYIRVPKSEARGPVSESTHVNFAVLISF